MGRDKTLATTYFKLVQAGVWRIVGSGAMYGGPNSIPMHPNLGNLLAALERDGITVFRKSTGSPVNASSYTFAAQFEDGGLFVETGNYWSFPRGGNITGAKALKRVIGLLDLRLTPRTARAWGLDS